MDPTIIMVSGAALGVVGGAAAAILAGASRAFRVQEDPRVSELITILPGANCGGCGYPGCAGFAAALAAGTAAPEACAPGGPEVTREIGRILGVEVQVQERMVARLICRGSEEHCRSKFSYEGISSCKAVSLMNRAGSKSCPFACEGLGDCVRVCSFGAMVMGPDGLPLIDEEKCTGCGKCVTACSKNVLRMERFDRFVFLGCRTQVAPKFMKTSCTTGCLGCRQCVRVCPYDALDWDGRLPHYKDDKCVSCGLCADVCKPGTILLARGLAPDPAVRAEAERLVAERKAAEAARKAAAKAAPAAKAPPPS
jgi:Na+-translocating ferredoxin:NAD+ oxidoreductase subunit B